jgi:hypothetical protein
MLQVHVQEEKRREKEKKNSSPPFDVLQVYHSNMPPFRPMYFFAAMGIRKRQFLISSHKVTCMPSARARLCILVMHMLEICSLHPERGVIAFENHIKNATAFGIFSNLLHTAA